VRVRCLTEFVFRATAHFIASFHLSRSLILHRPLIPPPPPPLLLLMLLASSVKREQRRSRQTQ